METYSGEVGQIIYNNEDSQFRVFVLNYDGMKTIKCVGEMPPIASGETLEITGKLEKDKRGPGMVLRVKGIKKSLPTTKTATFNFLKSGMIKGIGPVLAEALIQKHGTNIFNIMDNDPSQLLQVSGVGPQKMKEILKGWREYRDIHDLMVFLQDFDFSIRKIQMIYKRYGKDSVQKIKDNPYCLIDDFRGIGFTTVDKIALGRGFALNSPHRIKAGIKYSLKELEKNGHVCSPLQDVIKFVTNLLDVTKEELRPSLKELSENEEIKLQKTTLKSNPFVYRKEMFDAEVEVKERLETLRNSQHAIAKPKKEVLDSIAEIEQKFGMQLSKEQKMAVLKAISNRLFVLTGGPGCGKTATCNFIVDFFQKQNKRILLASPTGKAAQRLSELADHPASTIHRMLGWNFIENTFEHNENNRLEVDVLLIDEFSMVDLNMFKHVLRAVPEHVQIVLVGDSDQLPSVAPGMLLHDFIKSGVFSVVKLTQVFRQAAKSLIVKNSHAINKDDDVHLPPFSQAEIDKGTNFFFIEQNDTQDINDVLKKVVANAVPKMGYTKDDVQVLSPMKKYNNGVHNINKYLQELLNPENVVKRQAIINGVTIRMGDRVIQTRNNYKHDVFNGDVGFVTDIDLTNQIVSVQFTEKEIDFPFIEAYDLSLAYALTIHKSQGSQYPVVVIPISYEHRPMLYKNLIYTGITRAQEIVIIIGEKKHLMKAIRTSDNKHRHSCLLSRLQSMNTVFEPSSTKLNGDVTKSGYQDFLKRKK